jgi:hypothetical protein
MHTAIRVLGVVAAIALVVGTAYFLDRRRKTKGPIGPQLEYSGLGSEGWILLGGLFALVIASVAGMSLFDIAWLRWVAIGSGVLILMLLGIVRIGIGGHR